MSKHKLMESEIINSMRGNIASIAMEIKHDMTADDLLHIDKLLGVIKKSLDVFKKILELEKNGNFAEDDTNSPEITFDNISDSELTILSRELERVQESRKKD